MWKTFAKLTILAGLSPLIQSSLASAQILQWTDSKGVIHFTDNPYLISESIRSLPTFTVRRDLDTKNNPSAEISAPLPALADSIATNRLDTGPNQTETSVETYAPQEVNIVVSNSNLQQANARPCKFINCKPVFRPNFDDRHYIHPSVFDGGPPFARPSLTTQAHSLLRAGPAGPSHKSAFSAGDRSKLGKLGSLHRVFLRLLLVTQTARSNTTVMP
jgi:hypothetical protein